MEDTGVRGLRVHVNQPIHLDWKGKTAVVINISEGGLAVQCMDVLQPGDSFAVAFPLVDKRPSQPIPPSPVQGSAQVVWSHDSGRAGLKFVELSEFDRFRLRQWIREQQRQQQQSN